MTLDYALNQPIASIPTPDLFACVAKIGETKFFLRNEYGLTAATFDKLRPMNNRIDDLLHAEERRNRDEARARHNRGGNCE